ncbi:MAG: tetratricopeptide repeat protein [Chitinivibrionales bacterium]
MKPTLLHSWNRDWVFAIALFTVTLAAYQPAWNGKPIWDDDRHITRPELRSVGGLVQIWTNPKATAQYYPLAHTVFWLEYHLWGNSTLGYHLLNILLHLVSALLIVKLFRRLNAPGAWFVAAIFALHPVQVESVAWITELKNTLSGVFFLSATIAYLKFDREREKNFYIAALALFILGLLSKSVIATLPVSLLAVFWWKRGKISWKNDVVPLLPFFMAGIVYGLFTAWVERKFIGAEGGTFTFSIIERCLIAGRATWFYLSKIFVPVNLIFIYPRWNVSQAIWWHYLFPVATLSLAGILWLLRNRSRAPLAAFLYFLATIFPAMGFFNVYPFRFSFVADHFLYLACIGPIAASVAGIRSAVGLLPKDVPRFPRPILYIIVLVALGALTWRQSGMYADAETLYMTTIRKNPDCWMAHNNLGLLLASSGRTSEAIFHYRAALETNPNYAQAHNNLGLLLAEAGRTDEAILHYQKALEINPNSAEVHANLGIVLTNAGRTDEAIEHYEKALEINPNYAKAHNNLGNRLMELGRIDEAMAHYLRALEINPDYMSALKNLAAAFVQKRQPAHAVPLLQRALALAKSAGDDPQAREITGRLDQLLPSAAAGNIH